VRLVLSEKFKFKLKFIFELFISLSIFKFKLSLGNIQVLNIKYIKLVQVLVKKLNIQVLFVY